MSLILGLGTNLGDREKFLEKAIYLINQHYEVTALSPVIETDPVDFLDQPKFLNQAIECQTPQDSPEEVLKILQRIEREVGRVKTFEKGPRIIDIDILFWENLFYQSKSLIIPHAQCAHREFVFETVKNLPTFSGFDFAHFKNYVFSIQNPQ